jgi:hypothetical protein
MMDEKEKISKVRGRDIFFLFLKPAMGEIEGNTLSWFSLYVI